MNGSLIAFVAIIAVASVACALDNGVGRTPAMGWNSLNVFKCDVNETAIRKTVDALVQTGLRDIGYRYVVVDDCWQGSRTWRGQIQADPMRFSSGMEALAQYVHERGMYFGLSSSAGMRTCAGFSGSIFREKSDAATYASWGVDYLKYDNCYTLGFGSQRRYTWMRDALNATDRHIVFSICNDGYEDPWTWGPEVGNSWRITHGIVDHFAVGSDNGQNDPRQCDPCGVVETIDIVAGLIECAAPGAFNDLDQLQLGNGGMIIEEYKTQLSFWAALKSPLFLGVDIHKLDETVLSLLRNPEVVLINQDPLGRPAQLMHRHEDLSYEIWVGDLSDGPKGAKRAVAVLFNRWSVPRDISFPLYLIESFGLNQGKSRVTLRDLWKQETLGSFHKEYTAKRVPPHGVVVLKATLELDEKPKFVLQE